MPPEQARQTDAPLGPASDVFALGGLLGLALCGRPPYPDTIRTVEEIAPALAATVSELAKCDAHRELAALARRCLSVDPAARPADAGELLAAYAAAQSAMQARARKAELVARRAVRVAVACVLLVLAGIGAFLFLDGERARQHAKQLSYYDALTLSDTAWRAGAGDKALAYADQAPKALRAWEWHHLQRRAHGERLVLTGHAKPCESLAYSPDGRVLATLSNDGTIILWDVVAGRLLRTLTTPRPYFPKIGRAHV